ncbi:MAG TPA: YciI family protein [Anaeromyxobacteraceae bacterium]|nr:YciI family protein [Anaeromyxobacteraceae bacterium]
MYVIALIRYLKPLEEVLKTVDAHRAYLRDLKREGVLLASGPFEPRSGGALLLRFAAPPEPRALFALRDADPFVREGLAQYEFLAWAPTIGKEELDRL